MSYSKQFCLTSPGGEVEGEMRQKRKFEPNNCDLIYNISFFKPKTHAPPRRFLYLRETSWRCEEGGGEGEEEKVSLLTQATARGVGKNHFMEIWSWNKIKTAF